MTENQDNELEQKRIKGNTVAYGVNIQVRGGAFNLFSFNVGLTYSMTILCQNMSKVRKVYCVKGIVKLTFEDYGYV